jgi:hypothetical protein
MTDDYVSPASWAVVARATGPKRNCNSATVLAGSGFSPLLVVDSRQSVVVDDAFEQEIAALV